jgi:transcriptional regulator with XRE-family HTH domain
MSDNNRIREICDRIRQLRVENCGARGKSTFARKLDISPSSYDYYEKGRLPPLDLLIRIAELTHANLAWLLTGKEAAERPSISASHPVISRAAKLLADHPDFAEPLTAFVNLLQETAAAFAKPQAKKTDATIKQVDDFEDLTEVGSLKQTSPATHQPAATTATHVPAIRLVSGVAGGEGDVAYDALGRQMGPGLSERQGWIPILGRSAAGIPHFWRDIGGGDRGVTALADVVARMRPRKARRIHQAVATGELAADATAQLVLLDAPEPPGTAEFVIAEHISRRYEVVFAVRIDGASMAPEILHGDVVILSPSCPAQQGKPAVVQLADQIGVTCKLFRLEGDRVHLIPVNEAFAPTDHPLAELRWALEVIARVRPV